MHFWFQNNSIRKLITIAWFIVGEVRSSARLFFSVRKGETGLKSLLFLLRFPTSSILDSGHEFHFFFIKCTPTTQPSFESYDYIHSICLPGVGSLYEWREEGIGGGAAFDEAEKLPEGAVDGGGGRAGRDRAEHIHTRTTHTLPHYRENRPLTISLNQEFSRKNTKLILLHIPPQQI